MTPINIGFLDFILIIYIFFTRIIAKTRYECGDIIGLTRTLPYNPPCLVAGDA